MLDHQEDIRNIPEEESTALTLPLDCHFTTWNSLVTTSQSCFLFQLSILCLLKDKNTSRMPMSNNIEAPISICFPSHFSDLLLTSKTL